MGGEGFGGREVCIGLALINNLVTTKNTKTCASRHAAKDRDRRNGVVRGLEGFC